MGLVTWVKFCLISATEKLKNLCLQRCKLGIPDKYKSTYI